MSVLTPKRVFVTAAAVLFAASAFARNPSPRNNARMAFHDKEGVAVLFGGRGPFDGATQLIHDANDTWLWTGTRWVQSFPLNRPAERAAHSMVYDNHRERIILFGGARDPIVYQGDTTLYNDTWAWQNGEWSQIQTPSAPSARQNAGLTYDIDRDRLVLFGGTILDDTQATKSIFDTWEFDGTTWTQVGTTGQPDVAKPVLAYDAHRKETILMGIDGDDLAAVMYRYDSTANTWSRITPATMPPCVNEGNLVFLPTTQTLFFNGGVCTTGTQGLDEVYDWNGTTWTKVTVNPVARYLGQAAAYDKDRGNVVLFGGSLFGATGTTSDTTTYRNARFRFPSLSVRPFPRSLAAFHTDPVKSTTFLYGGLFQDSSGYLDDLWGYRGQQWYPITPNSTDGPDAGCTNPLNAFDTDRNKLVLTCGGTAVFEFDSSTFTWKGFTPSKVPDSRRFAGLVYDKKLRKTVLFGGYGLSSNYYNETWLWDGTTWTQIKTKNNETPTKRSLMAMWYDPLQQKTIIYGGVGRENLNQRATRYEDMWAFDGTKWAKLNVTQTPGQRFGPQITVDPQTGKLLLFGGLVAEPIEEDNLRQFFANDTWIWDGAANSWTKLDPERSPDPRENGMMTWDPLLNEVVLFGGYSYGFYHSDLWAWNGQTWRPLVDQAVRRRAAGK